MTKKIIFFTLIISVNFLQGNSQAMPDKTEWSQDILGLKSNLVYDITTTLNIGIEYRFLDYLSFDFSINYNPWTFSKNKKLKHILFQPELRYWINKPYNKHFVGGHILYSHYNVGNLPFGSLNNYRYQGDGYGLGISYGYQCPLFPGWNLEATIGVGYIYFDYARYDCETCGQELGNGHKNYFGPTKIGLSLIYILK